MRRIVVLSLGVMLLICPVRALGASSVVVESKDVPTDATGISIGIYIENDDSLAAIVIPLQFREVMTGSFIADTLAIIPQNRLESYLIGSVVTDYFPGPDSSLWWRCSGEGFETRSTPDFVSPDAVIFAAVATSDSCLPIGDDGTPPGGSPSLLLTFNVTDVQGTFEIDTACITPNNHLRFASCTDFDGIIRHSPRASLKSVANATATRTRSATASTMSSTWLPSSASRFRAAIRFPIRTRSARM